MPSLASNINQSKQFTKNLPNSIIWEGPSGMGPNGGVTQSLLCKFLVCRERFRLQVVEGLREVDRFNHRIHYGLMWHVCEEALAAGWSGDGNMQVLTENAQDLLRQYPTQQQDVEKWYNVCRVQFPEYIKFWSKHQDVKNRIPLLQEQVFDVPYHLPSGRVVRLRGRWDSVDIVNGGIWLQENKTKGDIDEQQIKRQLTFDLQTMTYLVALGEYKNRQGNMYEMLRDAGALSDRSDDPIQIQGVRFNVIRRPLSGGKGTIVQKKSSKNVPAETKEQYFARLAEYIRAEPETYFMRWQVGVSKEDIAKFRHQCLDPILEQLCDWWEYINTTEFLADQLWTGKTARTPNRLHFRMPFGVYSPLLDGGSTELDECLKTGSEVGLRRVDNLFPELK